MKKYLSTLVAVILAALSFTLASCGDDKDEPDPNGGGSSDKMEINGVAYSTVGVVSLDGGWNKATGHGSFTLGFNFVDIQGTIYPDVWSMYFTSPSKPKVGDDLATMGLFKYGWQGNWEAVSGKATITAINGSEMTVKYENLTLRSNDYSGTDNSSYDSFSEMRQYVVNGTQTASIDLNSNHDEVFGMQNPW